MDNTKCNQCAKELPKSAALTAEGKDHTYHFCSIPCYEGWSKAQRDAMRQTATVQENPGDQNSG